ncbi:MAG: hypothetical protein ACREC5_05355, partial [Thermoplasmata archaeon]
LRAGAARVDVALGLLLTNGMIEAEAPEEYSWQRQRAVERRYRITTEGKKFLLERMETSDRVG